MNENWLMQAIDSAGATVLFGLIVLAGFGLMMLALMFFLLAIRGIFHAMRRWLVRHTWGDVVRGGERRALRSATNGAFRK